MNSNLLIYLLGAVMAIMAWPLLMTDSPSASTLPPAAYAATMSGKPVLLEFSATWCGPCQQVKPEVHAFAEQVKGRAEVVMIDIDQNRALADQYNVHAVPTFIALKHGKEIERISGGIPQSEMRRMLGL
jgi:thioredoxin